MVEATDDDHFNEWGARVQIERVEGVTTIVGEGPIWHAATQSLWFVDILGNTIHCLAADRSLRTWVTPSSPGAVALTADARVAVALEDGFSVLDPATGTFSTLTLAGCLPGARISEGKVDRQGRFVALSGDAGFREPIGAIHRWEGPDDVRTLDDDFILGNGPCWSLDGTVFYVADSLRGVIYAYDYYAESGGVGQRRVFFSAAEETGFPDGATVDAEGHLWSVLHGSPWIVRLTPQGNEERRIRMPSPNISSVAFGGPDFDELYVTSLDPRRIPGISSGDTIASPGDDGAGSLYRVTGIGVRGVAEPAVTTWGHIT